VWESFGVKVVATIVAPILLSLIYFLLRRAYSAFLALRLVEAALRAVRRQEKDGIKTEGPGFWLKQPVRRPANYADLRGTSIPILMIAATKGGVGKTSLAGSLAAHFAMRWTQRRQNLNADSSLRVLVIDQDFQGSFTTMTIHADRRYSQPSKANRLVSGELRYGGVKHEAESISQTGMTTPLAIWTIPAYYDLAQAENRMLIEWLLPVSDEGLLSLLLRLFKFQSGATPKPVADLRYLLAESLLDSEVQKYFDLIILDSPPRLTTSHIQAMCASTHVLVPTILDGLSGDAVARYLDQIATHSLGLPGAENTAICPYIQAVGVVCTMIPPNPGNLDGRVTELKGRISAARLRPEVVPQDCFIKQRTAYREHAGECIAYAAVPNDQNHRDLREEVDRLGYWLAPKLGAEARGWRRR
jgi:cellulose biosynthesis protein BcsQ